MEDCATSIFLGNWVFMVSYLCSKFLIFIDPFWRNMFFKLKGAHTSFSLAFVQFEITFLSQLGEGTLRCYTLDVQESIFHNLKFFNNSLF
jgi:hypothetical protein